MKKILSLLCIVALLVTVTACAKKKEETVDRSGTTVAGKVTSINGSVVELTLGTLEESSDEAEETIEDIYEENEESSEKLTGSPFAEAYFDTVTTEVITPAPMATVKTPAAIF